VSLQSGVWLFPNATPRALVEAIELADASGIGEVWLGDEGPIGWDPFAICAAASLRTRRVVLGVAVANPHTRHPGASTLAAMTIFELSLGRFRLAYGPGGSLPLEPFGLEASSPVATLEWALRVSRSVAHAATLVDPRPGFSYHPPPDARPVPDLSLWVGARGPRLNEVAARLADGVFLSGIDRFQLPVVAGWVREARPSTLRAPQVATYLTACFSDELISRYAAQFIHGIADGPETMLGALGLDRVEVKQASDQLRSGNDSDAVRLLCGPVLDSVLATGTNEKISGLLAESALATSATSVGIAVMGDDPVADVSRCVDVFQTMGLIS
jgi:alkanesulfonate monooxygenase SsuD/methylene tetrahydromethanopterin reductase-like flavin-dependent oxidoreductase (luciferase family)